MVNKKTFFKIKVDGFPMSSSLLYKYYHDWLVIVLHPHNLMILLNPFIGVWLELPFCKPFPCFFLCKLSASMTPNYVVLEHDYINHLYVWRLGNEFWIKEKARLEDFDIVLRFEGKFYTLLQWMLIDI